MSATRLALLLALAATLAVVAGAETPVALDPADQRNVSVSGTLVAWDDDRTGDRDVYVRDLATGAETRVGAPGTDEMNPDLDGSRVVYASAGDILLHDFATGATATLTAAPGEQARPRISGRWIAWEERAGADADVWLHDLSTGTARAVTAAGSQHSPAVDGNQVAWIAGEPSTGTASIVVLDTASGGIFVAATAAGIAALDLGGGAVTYLAPDAGLQRVFRAAITGGIPRAVDAVPGEHRAQRIDGARVAVEAGGEIWVYGMNFDTATKLTANGAGVTDRNPAIDGTLVAWETDRNGNWDVYAAEIDGATIGPAATVPPTVAPTPSASRFGARRYVVGAVPSNPRAGTATGTGRAVATVARSRPGIGPGTATGTSPPASRFVRWSPLARWRAGPG